MEIASTNEEKLKGEYSRLQNDIESHNEHTEYISSEIEKSKTEIQLV